MGSPEVFLEVRKLFPGRDPWLFLRICSHGPAQGLASSRGHLFQGYPLFTTGVGVGMAEFEGTQAVR